MTKQVTWNGNIIPRDIDYFIKSSTKVFLILSLFLISLLPFRICLYLYFPYILINNPFHTLPCMRFHELLRKDEADILNRWYTCDKNFKIQLSQFHNDCFCFSASDDFEPMLKVSYQTCIQHDKVYYKWLSSRFTIKTQSRSYCNPYQTSTLKNQYHLPQHLHKLWINPIIDLKHFLKTLRIIFLSGTIKG